MMKIFKTILFIASQTLVLRILLPQNTFHNNRDISDDEMVFIFPKTPLQNLMKKVDRVLPLPRMAFSSVAFRVSKNKFEVNLKLTYFIQNNVLRCSFFITVNVSLPSPGSILRTVTHFLFAKIQMKLIRKMQVTRNTLL